MRTTRLVRLAAAALALAAGSAAHAESLRCNGRIASEGDSRLALLYKCGPPLLADAYCAPVVFPATLHPVPPVIAGAFVPCQPVEEWLYERGPGNLVATVRLRSGIVQSIVYGHQPR